ncbi:MAG: DUF3034 family protein [Legionella sp.]|nr:MAG: DUF3034 family protein [Legionella sp.]
MKKDCFFAVALAAVIFSGSTEAGPPFINLEGVGGAAFNPFAYPAITSTKDKSQDFVAKPRFGTWYVNLDSDIDWTTIGAADTFFKRLELSYGYESVNLGSQLFTLGANLWALSQNVHKNNIGAKLLLLEENSFDTSFIPAISAGAIYKTTDFRVEKLGDPLTGKNGFDVYLVATKMITQLPKSVLLSAGVLSSRGQVNGIIGFNDQRKETFFGNVEILPLDTLVIGFEYKQGPRFSSFKNDNYWNIHIAWLVNKNLTLIGAYAYAGDKYSTTKVGLGGGPVLSAQYAF